MFNMKLLLQEYSSKLSQTHSSVVSSRRPWFNNKHGFQVTDAHGSGPNSGPGAVHCPRFTHVRPANVSFLAFVIVVELIDARVDRWIHIDSLYDLRMHVEVYFDELRNINYIKNISLPHLSYTSDPWTIVILRTSLTVIMTALCNRADHYIFALWFLLYIFYLFFLA